MTVIFRVKNGNLTLEVIFTEYNFTISETKTYKKKGLEYSYCT